MSWVNEDEIVDNTLTQALFREMMEGRREARVYVIRDRKERGKTTLMRLLRFNCRTRIDPRRPAGIVDLEEFDHPSEYMLVKTIGEQIGPEYLPEFDRLEQALYGQDPLPFLDERARPASGVDARGAHVEGHAQVAELILNAAQGANVQLQLPERRAPEWQESLRPRAERKIVSAFFDDLRALPPARTVALFIDSVDEKASSQSLKQWVKEELLEATFLDFRKRPRNAILCVAGRDLPDYARVRPDDFDRLVAAPQLLTDWEEAHTEAFLRLALGAAVDPWVLRTVHDAIVERSLPLKNALQVAHLLAQETRR